MLISLNKIIGILVYTASGVKLGRVVEINLDTNTHTVQEYKVRASIFVPRTFLVKPIQVVEINKKSMVVEDGICGEIDRVQQYGQAVNS
jgi:sporulation protein YlmC with PRC-barrel domain